MAARPVATETFRSDDIAALWRRPARWMVGAATASLFAMSVVLLVRRLVGALARPLDGPSLILAGVAVAGVAVLLRFVWDRTSAARRSPVGTWAVLCLPAAALGLLGWSLSARQPPGTAVATLWLILVGEEIVSFFLVLRRRRAAVGRTAPAERPTRGRWSLLGRRPSRRTEAESVPATSAVSPPAGGEQAALPARATQQWTRARDDDGRDVLDGWLRGRFVPEQRALTLHVAFCPPFLTVPGLEVKQAEGPPVSIVQSRVQPFGARLDVRRRGSSAGGQDVVIELHVRGKLRSPEDRLAAAVGRPPTEAAEH